MSHFFHVDHESVQRLLDLLSATERPNNMQQTQREVSHPAEASSVSQIAFDVATLHFTSTVVRLAFYSCSAGLFIISNRLHSVDFQYIFKASHSIVSMTFLPGGTVCQGSIASWCYGRPDQLAVQAGRVEVCVAVAEKGGERMDRRL